MDKTIACPKCGALVPCAVFEPGYIAICRACGTRTKLTRAMVEEIRTRIIGIQSMAPPQAIQAPSVTPFPMPSPAQPPVSQPTLAHPPVPPAALEPIAPNRSPFGQEAAVAGVPRPGDLPMEFDADDLSSSKTDSQVPDLILPDDEVEATPLNSPEDLELRAKLRTGHVNATQRYKEMSLAKLAVDLGNLGRTRGYMAAVLFLMAVMLPAGVLVKAAGANSDPKFVRYMLWDWATPPAAADFSLGASVRVWEPSAMHYAYVIGLPLVAIFTFLAARFARYRTRGRYYLLLAIAGGVTAYFSPFSHEAIGKSPMGLYDPWFNFPDVLIVPLVGFQLGNMLVLRNFSDVPAVRKMTIAGTAAVASMAAIMALMPMEINGIMASKFEAIRMASPLVATTLCLLLGSLVLLPMVQLLKASPLTHALAVFAVLVLMVMLPVTVMLGFSTQIEPMSAFKLFAGLFAPALMLSIAVAELLHNGLLMHRVAEALGGNKDAWFSPEFKRMRLQARLESHDIDLAQYKTEMARIDEEERRKAERDAKKSARISRRLTKSK